MHGAGRVGRKARRAPVLACLVLSENNMSDGQELVTHDIRET